MNSNNLKSYFKKYIFLFLLLFPLTLRASFIEATIGTAVVNDATATYYNPAALTLLKNPQIINLDSVAFFHTKFQGDVIQVATQFKQSGKAETDTHYYLPSLYVGMPIKDKFAIGMAVVMNDFNRDLQEDSILRYAQSNNHVQDIDLVPGLAYKLTENIAIGANVNISHASFLLEPIAGAPSLNIPDSQSKNTSNGTSIGGDVGILLKPSKTTLLGFNYRSAMTYHMHGESIFNSHPKIISKNYHYQFFTPARNVFSINQFITKQLGLIGTLQRIDWSIFNRQRIFNIGSNTGIIAKAVAEYHLHNAWLITFGTHYRITPDWIVRMAATYGQTPATGHYQITNGDSVTLGGSIGYKMNKYFSIDASYAHAFIASQKIDIANGRNLINGINQSVRDAISFKFTVDIV